MVCVPRSLSPPFAVLLCLPCFSARMALLPSVCLPIYMSTHLPLRLLQVLTALPFPQTPPLYQIYCMVQSQQGPTRYPLTSLYFITVLHNVLLEWEPGVLMIQCWNILMLLCVSRNEGHSDDILKFT